MAHHHDPSHAHAHAVSPMNRAFGVGIALNVGFLLTEIPYGLRSHSLSLVADAGVSCGVVVAGAGILLTGWTWLDPVIGVLVSLAVLASAWPLFRSALDLAMDAVPAHVDLDAVNRFLRQCPDVLDLHHLHVWALSTTSTALSVHLVLAPGTDAAARIPGLARALHDLFKIDHSTVQSEFPGDLAGCPLAAASHFHAV